MASEVDPELALGPGADEVAMELLVRQVAYEAEGVVSLVLARRDGAALPRWSAGSHLDVVLPSGLVRQYSLCGDLDDATTYKIAVLRERDSRGGSREIHDSALVGRELTVRGPRNRFELAPAQRYLFVAGGIGITPIVPMLQDAERAGVPWRLVYGGRTRAHMAFVAEIAGRRGGAVELLAEDEVGMPDLVALVASADASTGIYACGPAGMLAALEERCAAAQIGPALHLERFSVVPGEAADGLGGRDEEYATFEVELRRSGTVLTVPPERTLLRCVRDVVPAVLFSCEEGYCGTCETRVLEGLPDHRDTVLTDDERAANKTMMICVGRARSARLVLDL